jgi:hypothetical protein
MISREDAQERLAPFHDGESVAKQLKRLERLSSDLASIGQVLIRAGPAWQKLAEAEYTHTSLRPTWDLLASLQVHGSTGRLRLFDALFPNLRLSVEQGWNLFDKLPYQSGQARRPFRDPSQDQTAAQVQWLQSLIHSVKGYEHQDVTWLAAWAPHLGYMAPDPLGFMFAAEIDAGGERGDEIFEILTASANGTHETGIMGRHVVRGLLCASRPQGWECIEGLLLAAQREEGLRQVILESIDEAHPQAFRRMLHLMKDHNLARFTASIRALGVWFGLPFAEFNPKAAATVLAQTLEYLDSIDAARSAIHEGGPVDAYHALWALAFDDVRIALPPAIELARSAEVERRYAALHFLTQAGVSQGFSVLLDALEDNDLRMPARVLPSLNRWSYGSDRLQKSDLFERLERLLPRIKQKQNSLKPLVWEWLPVSLDRETVAENLIEALGDRSPSRLLPHLPSMGPNGRYRVAVLLRDSKQVGGEILQALLSLAGDTSPRVRHPAIKALETATLQDADVTQLEALLTRQAPDLRSDVMRLLLNLPDEKLAESIRRLLSLKPEKQRLAALEMLKECRQHGRLAADVQQLALAYQARKTLTQVETGLVEELLAGNQETHSLEDGLGLMDREKLTRPAPVRPPSGIKLGSRAAVACLQSLDALIAEHRNDEVQINKGSAKATELLGNIRWRWMLLGGRGAQPQEHADFPLRELSEAWWASRPAGLRDADGHELIRAHLTLSLFEMHWMDYSRPRTMSITGELQKHYDVPGEFKLDYIEIVRSIVDWLISTHPSANETDFIIAALEESIARIPQDELTGTQVLYGQERGRAINPYKLAGLELAQWVRDLRGDSWTAEHHGRLWRVVRWLDEPAPGLSGEYASLEDALFGYRAGAATRDDIVNMFLGPRPVTRYGGRGFHLLGQFTTRKLHASLAAKVDAFPILKEIVEACRERILDVECRRGELPTAATAPSRHLRSVPGINNLFRMLAALGGAGFARGYSRGTSRSETFSHLIRNSFPLEDDTLDDFIEQAQANHIPEKRLVELAVYAHQWVSHVQKTIGWKHLEDAVWWLYAHTKDRQWTVQGEIREEWAARISEYTPLTANDLMDGAVDVAWFHKAYQAVGEERWDQLYEAAVYTSGGIGHGRARLFSDAMLGRVSVGELTGRILKKRHQDAVRALGLIPLQDKKTEKEQILNRYEVMQEFLRTGKKFGSQRQASEKLAVSIGMQNLARTAGYADPQRLEWAMETEAVADLAAGPVVVRSGDLQVRLKINELGEPVLDFQKKDKPIKALPSSVRKETKIAEVLARKQQLDRQVSRMRLSLEGAMCRGDEFTPADLKGLLKHPMLKIMIEQLVFVCGGVLGFPTRKGAALVSHRGLEHALSGTDRMRIAHPLDLMAKGEWNLWQRECFVAERIQPFKQIFRELYVLTQTERGEGNVSRRYAGHQVNPRQAVALFGARGWVMDPEEGVRKTFHAEGYTAHVGFLQGAHTPAEVEDAAIEVVAFTKRGGFQALPLEDIPARIFSEVMRDLDLVVSVAHAGGVDPESSASSIEARASLLRETCTLLKLSNVKLSERHVLIDGAISNYNVNLGSGVVHKQPGGALCIIPVHSQQRGRIFLPFVDNDPKTAEIVSKVILLARDDQIRDPTILEQIL